MNPETDRPDVGTDDTDSTADPGPTLARIRRLLADPDPEYQAEAISVVAEWAEAAGADAWDAAPLLPPRERMLVALQAIAEAVEEIGTELEAGEATGGK